MSILIPEKKKEEKKLYKWNYIPCSWIEKLNTAKVSILPKVINEFNAHQNSHCLFCKNEKVNSQIHMRFQGAPINQNNTKKKKEVGGLILSNFRA